MFYRGRGKKDDSELKRVYKRCAVKRTSGGHMEWISSVNICPRSGPTPPLDQWLWPSHATQAQRHLVAPLPCIKQHTDDVEEKTVLTAHNYVSRYSELRQRIWNLWGTITDTGSLRLILILIPQYQYLKKKQSFKGELLALSLFRPLFYTAPPTGTSAY